jgi:excisionase family DNA binding protein
MNEEVLTFDGLLDLNGAARYLNVTKRFLRGACKRRQVTFSRLSQKVFRFSRADLDEYLNRRQIKAKGVYS